jgi:hypothetical protein
MKLFLGIALTFLAQVLVWFQINGQFKWTWLSEHKLATSVIFAIPISVLFVYSAPMMYSELAGKVWTVKLISFGTGMISFFFLSLFLLNEHLDLKNLISLALSVIIILIQVLWK